MDGARRDTRTHRRCDAAACPRRSRHSSERRRLGVNVSGYLDTESGMGEAARASIRSLEAAGIPVALNNVPSTLRKRDVSYASRIRRGQPAPVQPGAPQRRQHGLVRRGPRPRVLPAIATPSATGSGSWRRSAKSGCPSSATSTRSGPRATSSASRSPPGPPSPSSACRCRSCCQPVPALGRAHFGLPPRGTVFLYVFDVSSQTERKNPRGAIEAFRRARFDHDQAVLVLKFTNAEYDREAVRSLHEQAQGLHVLLLDGYMDREELCALLATADCYFSPHRSEGFGLTMLESMSARQAGDRHGLLRQHGLHDRRRTVSCCRIGSRPSSATTALTCAARCGPTQTSMKRRA